MQSDLIRIIKKRRDDVHRRIGEVRSELALLEARAGDLEEILKEALAAERAGLPPTIVVQPKLAITPKAKRTVADLIVDALKELDDVGYEGADRAAIFKIVVRSAPKMKDNTFRVVLRRLVGKRIDQTGNLYRLRDEDRAATS